MKEQDYYSIGEASAITGVSAKTLRYYDDIHLIVPERRNSQNNYRYYRKDQIIQLIVIRKLRSMGCNLKSIKAVVEKNDLDTLRSHVNVRMEAVREEVLQMQELLESLQEFKGRLDHAAALRQSTDGSVLGSYLLNNARIEEIPVVKLFTNRRVMPNYCVTETSLNLWTALYDDIKKHGVKIIGPAVATYHTGLLEQFTMRDCDLELGVQVEELPGCRQIREFGGFTAATAIHIGDYSAMINTYVAILQWISRNGYEVIGDISEECIIAPVEIGNPKDNITKVIMPVRKSKRK